MKSYSKTNLQFNITLFLVLIYLKNFLKIHQFLLLIFCFLKVKLLMNGFRAVLEMHCLRQIVHQTCFWNCFWYNILRCYSYCRIINWHFYKQNAIYYKWRDNNFGFCKWCGRTIQDGKLLEWFRKVTNCSKNHDEGSKWAKTNSQTLNVSGLYKLDDSETQKVAWKYSSEIVSLMGFPMNYSIMKFHLL